MSKKFKFSLLIMLVITSLLLIVGCGSSNNNESNKGAESEKDIEIFWWADQAKSEKRVDGVKKFNEDSDIDAKATYSGWDGYWDKLSTKVSGGNPPDVFLMSSRYLRQYANKDALLDLSEEDIDVDDFEKEGLETGEIEGKLYGIPTGVNAFTLVYNKDMLDEFDVDFNADERLTWEEFKKLGEQTINKFPDDKYAFENSIRDWELFQYFVRDEGETMYDEDGKSVNFSKDTMTKWFDYWLDLQEEGITPPAEETASYEGGEHEQRPMVKDNAAFVLWWNNQAEIIDGLVDDEIKTALAPTSNNNKPDYLHASSYWVISSETANVEGSIDLLEYLLKDSEFTKKMQTDDGVPINKSAKNTLEEEEDTGDEVLDQISIIDDITEVAGDSPTIDSVTAGEFENLMGETAESVMFGDLEPNEATEQFFEEAESIAR